MSNNVTPLHKGGQQGIVRRAHPSMEVRDRFCPWNDGRWRLSGQDLIGIARALFGGADDGIGGVRLVLGTRCAGRATTCSTAVRMAAATASGPSRSAMPSKKARAREPTD